MDEISFSYEITKEDYAEANVLLCRGFKYAINRKWLMPAVGLLILALPFGFREDDGSIDRMTLGLLPLGLIFIYLGLRYHCPRFLAKMHYPNTGLAGHQFNARISGDGLHIRSANIEWRYGWPTILMAKESEKVFMFYTGIEIFIFGKRYLTGEQIEGIQTLIAAQPAFPGGFIPKF